MQVSIKKEDRNDIVAKAFQTATAVMTDTIEAGVAELQAQYRLQVASYVPLADKRAAVAGLIDSSLPSDVQDQISDSSVIAVFSDLVRTGLVEIEVEWTEELPPPANVEPEPPPAPTPEE